MDGEPLYRLRVPLILGAIAYTAGLLAQVLAALGDKVPAAVLCGPIFVATAPLVNHVARRMAPHGRWAAWVAAAIAAGGYLFALTPDFHRLVDELEPDAFAVPLLFAVVAALLARWPARWRTPHRAFIGLAWASVVVVGALTTLGAVRASRWPTPNEYIGILPIVGTIPRRTGSVTRESASPLSLETRADAFEEDVFGPIVVRRFVFADDSCVLVIRARGEPLPSVVTRGESHSFDCNTVTIFRDARQGLLIACPGGTTEPLTVVRESPAERIPETAMNTAMFVVGRAVPRTYVAGGALGVFVALAALLWPFRSARWLRRRADWREGTLGGKGFITFDDGAPPFDTPLANRLSRGRVVAIFATAAAAAEASSASAAYRDGSPRTDVELVPGSLEALEAEARGSVEARPAFALAAVLLCGAPLIAAALCGLVVP